MALHGLIDGAGFEAPVSGQVHVAYAVLALIPLGYDGMLSRTTEAAYVNHSAPTPRLAHPENDRESASQKPIDNRTV
jgi:hypothetical protein